MLKLSEHSEALITLRSHSSEALRYITCPRIVACLNLSRLHWYLPLYQSNMLQRSLCNAYVNPHVLNYFCRTNYRTNVFSATVLCPLPKSSMFTTTTSRLVYNIERARQSAWVGLPCQFVSQDFQVHKNNVIFMCHEFFR